MAILEDRGIWGVGGYEILDILSYENRYAEGGGHYFYCVVRHTVSGKVYGDVANGQEPYMSNTVCQTVRGTTPV